MQQECEEGMSIPPHSFAMSRQQARSSAVSTEVGKRQAMTAGASNIAISPKTANLAVSFNTLSIATVPYLVQ